ncbi:MAG: methionine--tRNA ligase [Bacteriovoracales bacterium]|nr:methionine--tRNA ligase [Bacteriovoracales bacterium]
MTAKDKRNSFYITTAIDYPSGRPHIGHAYEKIVTDFYARWNRLNGKKTHYLTGTDENGQKLIRSAEKEGRETLDYVDERVEEFRALCTRLHISHDDFIRTTEDRHRKVCRSLWEKLAQKDEIYFDEYSGQYCYDCENFYTNSQAPEGKCPHHGKPLVEKKEEGYFFKLSRYRERLVEHIKRHPEFISPNHARKEVLSRLEDEELRDLAISRPNEKGWGIPVPGDDRFVMYTWFDAVINYYAALSDEQKSIFWPAHCHVIGKDIVWFHTVIWPAILMGCALPLPLKVYVHGMVLAHDGQKMSKSLDNVIDPWEMTERYPIDSFRYYMLRAISASGDGRFSERDLCQRHNGELGDDLGNLVFRVIKFSLKKGTTVLTQDGLNQELFFETMAQKFSDYVDRYEHNKAIDALWESIRKANQYFNNAAPWKIKDDPQRVNEILCNCLHALHVFCFFLSPVMPEKMKTICGYLGVSLEENPLGHFDGVTFTLTEPQVIFSKFDELPPS